MRPLDPAALPHLRPAAAPLSVVVGAGLVGGLATVAQAFALGALVVAAVTGASWAEPAGWFVALVLLRTAAAHAGQLAATRAAGAVSGTLRRRLLEAARGA